MKMYRLRILHLSDLHERVELDWMNPERKKKIHASAANRHRVLGNSFIESLKEIRSVGDIHLICFTGDIADWGLEEEYANATKRIDTILNVVGVSLDRLFVVPGNHDVNWKKEKFAWEEMRRLAKENPDALSEWMADIKLPYGANETWRDATLARTSAYREWLAKGLGRHSLLAGSAPHGRLGYRVFLDDLNLPFPVCIIGLDSAWLAGDDNDQGKLLLTQFQVNLLATDNNGKAFPGFRIALIHHPLSFLADQADIQPRIADWTDILLHGHQHEPIIEFQENPDRALRIAAAGSLYEGDRGDKWLNSFQIIDVTLDSEGKPFCYDIDFWGWSKSGHWYKTGAIYRAAKDGKLTWLTPYGKEQRIRYALGNEPSKLKTNELPLDNTMTDDSIFKLRTDDAEKSNIQEHKKYYSGPLKDLSKSLKTDATTDFTLASPAKPSNDFNLSDAIQVNMPKLENSSSNDNLIATNKIITEVLPLKVGKLIFLYEEYRNIKLSELKKGDILKELGQIHEQISKLSLVERDFLFQLAIIIKLYGEYEFWNERHKIKLLGLNEKLVGYSKSKIKRILHILENHRICSLDGDELFLLIGNTDLFLPELVTIMSKIKGSEESARKEFVKADFKCLE